MKKPFRISFALLCASVLILFLVSEVLFFGPRDPLFQGKPESQWIKELSIVDEDAARKWRSFGTEGVELLIRGLNNSKGGSAERSYRWMMKRLPVRLRGWFPTPKPDTTSGTRMLVLDLLGTCDETNLAQPSVVAAFDDEDANVRIRAIGYFTRNEGGQVRLNGLPPTRKAQLLPMFVKLAHDSNKAVRYSSIKALGYYLDSPKQRGVVIETLTNALSDNVLVRFEAAALLTSVESETASNFGAVPVLVGVLKTETFLFAPDAAELLGRVRSTPELVVPALINGLSSTKANIAAASASALTNFPDHTNLTIPALEQATRRTDAGGDSARQALALIRSVPPTLPK
jgi:hypothetical protein